MTSSRDDIVQISPFDPAHAGDGLPSVSVVLPFLDAEDTIEAQLAALRQQTYTGTYEVIAADNGSADGSRRIVERCSVSWPRLRLVDASRHEGVSHARNEGLAAACGDIVLGCDADDIAASDWVERMVAALVERRFDIVGGRFEERSLNPRAIRGWFSMHPESRLQASFGVAPVATGANFGAWRTVAQDVGGWDTRYVGGGEDIVFSWRAQELGYTVGCAADASVHHRRRSTLATLARQSFRRGRVVPRLMSDFRRSPLGRPRFRRGTARTALTLLASTPRALFRSKARGQWLRVACTAAGVLVGRMEWLVEATRRIMPRSRFAGARAMRTRLGSE